jgi:hypothetical protein
VNPWFEDPFFWEFQQTFLILTIASLNLPEVGREPLGDGQGSREKRLNLKEN